MTDQLSFIHPEFTGEELIQLQAILTELMERGSVLKASFLVPDEVKLLQSVVEKISHMSDPPLWRSLPEPVQDAIIENHMDIEQLDKHRSHDEVDRITNLDELYRYFSDTELLGAVHLGLACLDDFKDADTTVDQPEAAHWISWQLMQQVGLCTEDGKVTERGLEHVRWDDETLLEE